MQTTFRSAVSADASRMSALAAALGYAVDESQACERIEALADAPNHVLLIAERATLVVGFAHATELDSFVSGSFAVLAALVVDPDARRAGVASGLVERAEAWARDRGLTRIIVRSRTTRDDAHAFYLERDYKLRKEQAVFAKTLGSASH